MKILILGPGYVGMSLVDILKSEGHQVDVTARSQEKADAIRHLVNEVLMWDETTPSNFLDPYECLIFTAAGKPPFTPDIYREAYLKNSQKISHAAATALNLKQIIYTSSTSVYGPGDGGIVTEESPLQATSPQATILIDTEKTLLAIPKVNVCVLRLGEIIGPGRSLEDRIKKQGSTPFAGTGENPVNLSPLDLIKEVVEKAIQLNLAGTYNTVIDYHPPRKTLYAQLAKDHNLPEPTWDPSLPVYHSGNRIVSSELLNKSLVGNFPKN